MIAARWLFVGVGTHDPVRVPKVVHENRRDAAFHLPWICAVVEIRRVQGPFYDSFDPHKPVLRKKNASLKAQSCFVELLDSARREFKDVHPPVP